MRTEPLDGMLTRRLGQSVAARSDASVPRHILSLDVLDSLTDPVVVLQARRDGSGRIVDFTCVHANTAAAADPICGPHTTIGNSSRTLSDCLAAWFSRFAEVVESAQPLAADATRHPFAGGASEVRVDLRAARVAATDFITITWRGRTVDQPAHAEPCEGTRAPIGSSPAASKSGAATRRFELLAGTRSVSLPWRRWRTRRAGRPVGPGSNGGSRATPRRGPDVGQRARSRLHLPGRTGSTASALARAVPAPETVEPEAPPPNVPTTAPPTPVTTDADIMTCPADSRPTLLIIEDDEPSPTSSASMPPRTASNRLW